MDVSRFEKIGKRFGNANPASPVNTGHKNLSHGIHVWYIYSYLHLVDFYGKCR